MRLKPAGVSPAEVLKWWNADCTKDSQLIGQRRTAVLNLLDAPDSAIQVLAEHLSEFGSDGVAFREDCFCSKRLAVGFQPRSGLAKSWQERLKVTAEGLTLPLRYLHEAHRRKCAESRVKMDRKAVEEAQQMAQLLVASVQEAQAQYPLSQEAVQEHILGPFVAGDMNLEMELQSALSELPSEWRSVSLTRISQCVQMHCDVRDTAMLKLTGQSLSIEAGQLEQQAFALALQGLKHDVACYQVWRARCSDRENALYFASLQHLTERQKKAREIAQSTYDAPRSPNWRFKFMEFGSEVGQCISDINSMYAAIQSITKKDAATTLIVLNWSSPGTFTAEAQRAQAAIMGSLMKPRGSKTIGVVLMPTYHYQRGKLFKLEAACVNALCAQNLNMDMSFALAFNDRNDMRETRAMVHPGRVVLPMGDQEYKELLQHFQTSPLFRKQSISDIDLPATKDLVSIEDMADNGLPETTNVATHATQAEKHQQLGSAAWRKLLQACAPAAEIDGPTLIVDLSTHTLDCSKAAYLEQQSAGAPIYYCGLVEDGAKAVLDWTKFHWQNWLADGYLSGAVPLPAGAALPSRELPEAAQQAMPPKPELGTLVWSTVKRDGLQTLKTPEKVLQAWEGHPDCGAIAAGHHPSGRDAGPAALAGNPAPAWPRERLPSGPDTRSPCLAPQ